MKFSCIIFEIGLYATITNKFSEANFSCGLKRDLKGFFSEIKIWVTLFEIVKIPLNICTEISFLS